MIWHPHIWLETAHLGRGACVRGKLFLGNGTLIDSGFSADVAVWALEDVLAGGVWRSSADRDAVRVNSITCERCWICGATRVQYDPRWRITDETLTDAQVTEWLAAITQRYRGQMYNGVLHAYGMTLEAMEKRLNPVPSQRHNHLVYVGPV